LTKAIPPPEIVEAARRRSAAREARDWATADLLRAEIEAAGWRVVDSGTNFRLEAVHPPEVVDGEVVRYGRSVGEADTGEVIRAVTAARRSVPGRVSFVVVANGMGSAAEAELERVAAPDLAPDGSPKPERGAPGGGPAIGAFELVRTSARLGRATALNMGLRRSSGSVVILLDPGIEAEADLVTPLVRVLDDPTVAVAGPLGLGSADLRRFDQVIAPGPGSVPTTAIEGGLMAFRRADAAARGPLDEQLRVARNLDIWWSLVLRDEGEDRAPRRALVVADLPLRRHEAAPGTSTREVERERLAKRSFYRVLDRFGRRLDLAVPGE